MTSKKRNQNHYQPAKKVSIIREHLIEKVPVSDVCDKHGTHPSVYYRWQKQFFEGGERAFAVTNEDQVVKQLKEQVATLEAKLARKDEVLGEVLEEYVTLKKSVGSR